MPEEKSMPTDIALRCALNVDTVPAGGEARVVYALIEVESGEGAVPLQAPVNMALVLDASESMRLPVLSQEQFQTLSSMGQATETISDGVPVWTFKTIPPEIRKNAPSNLEAVQSSIAQSAGHFEEHDRLSLVVFADRAQVLLSGVPGSQQRRLLDAVASLASVQLGDETNLAAGLRAGIEEVRRGLAPDMVSRVLILTDGFTREPEQVLELVGEARRAGIAVSTLGIGGEFNERLLVQVADSSLANAYFARVPQEIPPAFAQELSAVQEVLLRDVEVDVHLSKGVEVRRAYRVRPAISVVDDARIEERRVSVAMGDVGATNPPALMLELVVPTQQAGTYRVAQVLVTRRDGSQRSTSHTGDLVLRYSPTREQPAPDPRVMNIVERVSAYVLQTRALDDVAVGNRTAATQKLKAAATRLLALGEVELAETVQQEAARMEQSGQLSPDAAKELRYATRRLGGNYEL